MGVCEEYDGGKYRKREKAIFGLFEKCNDTFVYNLIQNCVLKAKV